MVWKNKIYGEKKMITEYLKSIEMVINSLIKSETDISLNNLQILILFTFLMCLAAISLYILALPVSICIEQMKKYQKESVFQKQKTAEHEYISFRTKNLFEIRPAIYAYNRT